MAFVHGTTTTINDAPAEDLILDAAKETPTTLKLGHNAEKYAKVSVFSYSCCWNILLGLRLIFSRLYKTYKNLRHTLIFRSLYLKQVLTQYKNWILSCQSKWKCSFYLSVYIFIIYLQRFLQVLFKFFLFYHLYYRMFTAFIIVNKLINRHNFFCRRQRLRIGWILLKDD